MLEAKEDELRAWDACEEGNSELTDPAVEDEELSDRGLPSVHGKSPGTVTADCYKGTRDSVTGDILSPHLVKKALHEEIDFMNE